VPPTERVINQLLAVSYATTDKQIPHVNVAGLVASSLDIATEDFLAGRWRFSGSSGAGAVVNQGLVQADGGLIALLAPRVSNSGSLLADGGQVVMAAGQKVSLSVASSGLVKVSVEQGAVDALVENKGLVRADGGSILLTAKGANDLLSGVVNNEGVVRAHTLQEREGRIVLLGDMALGTAQVAGQLDASAPQGGNGGFIETSAAQVFVAPSASVTTLAAQGRSGQRRSAFLRRTGIDGSATPGPTRSLDQDSIPNSSTSNTSVALGGIAPG
jgi:hypothetical protein